MKKQKRILGLLLAALLVTMLFPALAVKSVDLTQSGELNLSYQDNGTPLAGAEFSIYLLAAVDEAGELTVTEEFANYRVDLQAGNDWKALAATLEGYVLRDSMIPTDKGTTDASGALTFPAGEEKLTLGLYLVLGNRHQQNHTVYDPKPFLVMVPNLENDTLNYRVTVNPKYESHDVPAEGDTVTRKVLKVWKDEGNEASRPKEITVRLLRNGEVYDTVTLSADNSWRHTWSDLDARYRWLVVEETPEGYTVEVTREGITFVVTNRWEEPDTPPPTDPTQPEDPKLPQTGQLWWPVPLLICGGLLCVVVGLIRRRGHADEE